METDPAADLAALASATRRLLDTADRLTDDELAAPSLLPGWTRGHVLTHVARNADGMRNLLLTARTGVSVPMYASRALRDADIEAGATRAPALIREDVRASAERFALDAGSLDADAWTGTVRFGAQAEETPAAHIPRHRLREVEAHHVDLGTAYTFAGSPGDVLLLFLDLLPRRFAGSSLDPSVLVATDLGRQWSVGEGDGPSIEGPAAVLLTWAMGRGGPDDLRCDRGTVPASPGWG
jgi:maleylpyruvate isomerase